MICVLIRIASMRRFLMRTHNIPSCIRKLKSYPHYASRPGFLNSTHKLELPLSRTHFHGSKGVCAIEVSLYIVHTVKENNIQGDLHEHLTFHFNIIVNTFVMYSIKFVLACHNFVSGLQVEF